MKTFLALHRILSHPSNIGKRWQVFFRALWWKCNQLFFHLPALVEILPDRWIICKPSNSFGSFIVYAGLPEYHETLFLLDYLRPKDVYVDVGAHIGFELIVASSKVNKGALYGFEPSNQIFSDLVTNVGLNNKSANIQIFQQAVSNKSGWLEFTQEAESEESHIAHSDSNQTTLKVKSITLDQFAEERKINRIDLLKVDTEGAEALVFEGAKSLLKEKKIACILFEVNSNIHHFKSTEIKLLTYLEQLGYSIYYFDKTQLLPTSSQKFTYKKTVNLLAIHDKKQLARRLKKFVL